MKLKANIRAFDGAYTREGGQAGKSRSKIICTAAQLLRRLGLPIPREIFLTDLVGKSGNGETVVAASFSGSSSHTFTMEAHS